MKEYSPQRPSAPTPQPNRAEDPPLTSPPSRGREEKRRPGTTERFPKNPVREDVEPDPPRLFRGFKYVIENPEDYSDFDATVKQYLEIFKLR